MGQKLVNFAVGILSDIFGHFVAKTGLKKWAVAKTFWVFEKFFGKNRVFGQNFWPRGHFFFQFWPRKIQYLCGFEALLAKNPLFFLISCEEKN